MNFQSCDKSAQEEAFSNYIERNAYTKSKLKPNNFWKYFKHIEEYFECSGFCSTIYNNSITNTNMRTVKYLFSDIRTGVPKYIGCLDRILDWLPKMLNAFGIVCFVSGLVQIILFGVIIGIVVYTERNGVKGRKGKQKEKHKVKKKSNEKELNNGLPKEVKNKNKKKDNKGKVDVSVKDNSSIKSQGNNNNNNKNKHKKNNSKNTQSNSKNKNKLDNSQSRKPFILKGFIKGIPENDEAPKKVINTSPYVNINNNSNENENKNILKHNNTEVASLNKSNNEKLEPIPNNNNKQRSSNNYQQQFQYQQPYQLQYQQQQLQYQQQYQLQYQHQQSQNGNIEHSISHQNSQPLIIENGSKNKQIPKIYSNNITPVDNTHINLVKEHDINNNNSNLKNRNSSAFKSNPSEQELPIKNIINSESQSNSFHYNFNNENTHINNNNINNDDNKHQEQNQNENELKSNNENSKGFLVDNNSNDNNLPYSFRPNESQLDENSIEFMPAKFK